MDGSLLSHGLNKSSGGVFICVPVEVVVRGTLTAWHSSKIQHVTETQPSLSH